MRESFLVARLDHDSFPRFARRLHHSIAQSALRGLAADAGRHGDFLDRQFAFLLQEKGFALRIGERGERGQQALHLALAVDQQVAAISRREGSRGGMASS